MSRLAARAARRAAHAAILRLPGVDEFLTVNDDFTDLTADLPQLLRHRRPFAAGGQETKGIDYGRRIGEAWGVRQRMRNDATAGVVVVWDRSRAWRAGHAHDDPDLRGGGWLPIIEPGKGDDMLTRGVVWQDLTAVLAGGEVRVGSYHRPPWRHRHLWAEADRRLEEWLDASPIPVVLLMDANEPGGPDFDDAQWRWRGVGIDGAVSNLRLPSAYELDRRRSDHRPVSIAARLGVGRATA